MTVSRDRGERDPQFEALLDYIRTSRGFDFSGYKRNALQRRVAKRMRTVGRESLAEYRDYLEAQPREFTELFNTILINVTSFFRDPAAWEALARKVIPKIAGKKAADEVRVWSAGCAGGEEPCTLAILLAEELGDEAFRKRVKLYATDVDEDALAHARRAVYTERDLLSVPRKFRRKYFEPQSGGFTFRADLRRSIIFGQHDLMQDAPISRLDLLVCRNTLMYFNADAQARIAARLHFALQDTGFIFLGKAEMLQSQTDLFSPVDLKHHIFAKVPGSRPRELANQPIHPAREETAGAPTLQEMLRAAAFDAATTPQIVVDSEGTLAAVNREARILFGLPLKDVGRPFKDMEISYRPVELRSLVEQVLRTRQPASPPDVSWTSPGGEALHLRIQLAPLAIPAEPDFPAVVVAFANVTRAVLLEEEIRKSRQEAETAGEELQSTNEELETTNEELQSTIEELETTNEELQSGNEEMETVNEELQSTNQELHAVNDELRQRTDDLNDINAFLNSMLASVNIGVMAVDSGFLVETWNRRCEDLWGLRGEEVVGKHLLNLDAGLPVDQLKAPVKAVMSGKSEYKDLILDAVNRRGVKIRCRVTCTPRFGAKKEVRGAILLMEQLNESEKKES